MNDIISVGHNIKKEVTLENHKLYNTLLAIMVDDRNQELSHMGRQGVSRVVDYLFKHYELKEKEAIDVELQRLETITHK